MIRIELIIQEGGVRTPAMIHAKAFKGVEGSTPVEDAISEMFFDAFRQISERVVGDQNGVIVERRPKV